MQANRLMTAKTTNAPIRGGTAPDATQKATRYPAKTGPIPLVAEPPSMDNPFMVARCDTGTVRFVVTVMLEKMTSPKILNKANTTLR